jgi:hypothetical protein
VSAYDEMFNVRSAFTAWERAFCAWKSKTQDAFDEPLSDEEDARRNAGKAPRLTRKESAAKRAGSRAIKRLEDLIAQAERAKVGFERRGWGKTPSRDD